jgi:hypothetical protein
MAFPFTNNPEEKFNVSISGTVYNFRQLWNENGYWTLDILDSDETAIALSIKIVAGIPLLQQYPQLPFELTNSGVIDPTRNTLSEFVLEVTDK